MYATRYVKRRRSASGLQQFLVDLAVGCLALVSMVVAGLSFAG